MPSRRPGFFANRASLRGATPALDRRHPDAGCVDRPWHVAAQGDTLALGDVISLLDGTDTIPFAQPFGTPGDRRVLVNWRARPRGDRACRAARLLRSIGCEYGQGYLLARPADGDELEPAIVEWDAERFADGELSITPPASLPRSA